MSIYGVGIYAGAVTWAPDGTAFLYLDQAGSPVILGTIDGSALWDVREQLRGARDFQWAGQRP